MRDTHGSSSMTIHVTITINIIIIFIIVIIIVIVIVIVIIIGNGDPIGAHLLGAQSILPITIQWGPIIINNAVLI